MGVFRADIPRHGVHFYFKYGDCFSYAVLENDLLDLLP